MAFDDFDGVRGPAIHIHDELVYADAAAFFGMNSMWDSVSHAQHYQGRADAGFYSETDTIVLIDVAKNQVVISPMGRAIGHYARWLRRGAVRVDATSADPLVLATGFVDSSQGRAVLVAINNADADRPLDIAFSGVDLSGAVEGEMSKAGAPWATVTGVTATAGHVKYVLPTHAVVTLSAPIRGGVIFDGGSDGATMPGAGGASTGGAGGGATSSGAGGEATSGGAGGGNPGAVGGSSSTAGGNSSSGGSSPGDVSGDSNSDPGASSSSGCGCRIGSTSGSGAASVGLIALALSALKRLARRPRRNS